MRKALSVLLGAALLMTLFAQWVIADEFLGFLGVEQAEEIDEGFSLITDYGYLYHGIAIYSKNDEAWLVQREVTGRYRERQLNIEEFAAFKQFANENKVDELEEVDVYSFSDPDSSYAWTVEASEETAYTYTHKIGDGCKSVNFIDFSYVEKAFSKYEALIEQFEKLAGEGNYESFYRLGEPAHKTYVLSSRENVFIQAVCKMDEELVVLVDETPNNLRDFAYQWYAFEGGQTMQRVLEPVAFDFVDAWADIPAGIDFFVTDNNYPWKSTWEGKRVRVFREPAGLYLTEKGKEPIQIDDGRYTSPVVVPGTSLVAVEQEDLGGSSVLIDLRTKQKEIITYGEQAWMRPLFSVGDEIVYILRASANGEKLYHYVFYHPITKQFREAGDIMSQISSPHKRFLQKAANSNAYYCVAEGVFGTMDFSDGTFLGLLDTGLTHLESDKIWVDEKTHTLYFAIDGDLVMTKY